MRTRALLQPLLLMGVLAGCVSSGSYVDSSLAPADAAMLAADMTAFVKSTLPRATSTLVLDPLPAGQAENALSPAFNDTLRQAGFAVAPAASAALGAQHIRYVVTPLEGGTLVQLTVGSIQAARFFVRTAAGSLQASGPFMVREASS